MSTFLSDKNDHHIELALAAIAGHATLDEAVGFLKTQGITTTPAKLNSWRRYHLQRFEDIRNRLAAKIEERAANDMFDGGRQADLVANIAVERTRELLEQGMVKDPVMAARIARDLQQVASQKLEKSMMVQGKPTKIVEHRNPDEIMRKLEAMGVVFDSEAQVVEGEAKELPTRAEA